MKRARLHSTTPRFTNGFAGNSQHEKTERITIDAKVALAPTLEKFVSKKLKTGTYLDASDVIRESLRRWREQEETGPRAADSLEQEIQEGLDSPDLPGGSGFWRDLRKELHSEHWPSIKRGARRL